MQPPPLLENRVDRIDARVNRGPADPLSPAAMHDKQATLIALAPIANGADLLTDLAVLRRSMAPVTALLALGLRPSWLPFTQNG